MDQTAASAIPPLAVASNRAKAWLARLTFVLVFVAVAVVVAFAGFATIAMLAVGLASAALSLAAGFWFLADRGVARGAALVLLVLSPIAAIVIFALNRLLWVALVSAAAWLLAGLAARAALTTDQADWLAPEFPAEPPAARPFFIMNPRSGGGKVAKFDLARRAERLGATVYLMTGPGEVDVTEVAREAVADGADLLGVAGGDGTQALVAAVAAEHDLPFVVLTAGTRNHFALDLGLDRDDPAAGLSALDDGVELHVDLGTVNSRTFVNNASFGAYAEVVQTPAYRDDKVGSTLDVLPDLLRGHRGPTLVARAGDVEIAAPQAVLVANNPYGMGDVAGLSRRARLDRGRLGIVAIKVSTARQAVALLRRSRATGLTTLTAPSLTIETDAAEIPVGIDGEAVTVSTPVLCLIRPAALRVRVPRNRPGVPPPRAPTDWAELRQLALTLGAGTESRGGTGSRGAAGGARERTASDAASRAT
jgi:diacylglycerol kinase family enzyme